MIVSLAKVKLSQPQILVLWAPLKIGDTHNIFSFSLG